MSTSPTRANRFYDEYLKHGDPFPLPPSIPYGLSDISLKPDIVGFDRQFSPDRGSLTDKELAKLKQFRQRDARRDRFPELKALRRLWLEKSRVYSPESGYGIF